MKTNLNVILSAIGVAALLASPAMAKQVRPNDLSTVPSDARGSVAPGGQNEGGPYTPSMPTLRYGTSRDFQAGGGDK
jgi:hypothetical protein